MSLVRTHRPGQVGLGTQFTSTADAFGRALPEQL